MKLFTSQMQTAQVANFTFSGMRPEKLGATEYTLVTLVVDKTGSVTGSEAELLAVKRAVVAACRKSPRANYLMLRSIEFNERIDEVHGFVELNTVDPAGYTAPRCSGTTRPVRRHLRRRRGHQCVRAHPGRQRLCGQRSGRRRHRRRGQRFGANPGDGSPRDRPRRRQRMARIPERHSGRRQCPKLPTGAGPLSPGRRPRAVRRCRRCHSAEPCPSGRLRRAQHRLAVAEPG